MRIKKYLANSLDQILAKIEIDFGSNANIISKKIIRAGFLGLWGPKKIEVIVAVENNKSSNLSSKSSSFSKTANIISKPIITSSDVRVISKESSFQSTQFKIIKANLAKNKNNMRAKKPILTLSSSGSKNLSQLFTTLGLQDFYQKLIGFDFSSDILNLIYQEIISQYSSQEITQPNFINFFLEEFIQKLQPITPNPPKYMFLVGPTGVGKTTTVAKLAAYYQLYQKKRIALITTDTYRIAGIEQLQMFSQLVQCELEVSHTPEDFKHALTKFQGYDIVLIDTAGRSPNNQEDLKNLQRFFQISEVELVPYLVLSLTSRNKDLFDLIKKFEIIPYNNLIITKLDETKSLGTIFDLLYKTNKQISYLTSGQIIPDDFEIFNPKTLAQRFTLKELEFVKG